MRPLPAANAARPRRKPMAEINVVPYIDVMLVLLVIFMVTAPLLYQGVKVDLPEAAADPVPQPEGEPLIVEVDADGRYYLSVGEDPDAALDGAELMSRVATVLGRSPGKAVLVRGDRNVPYGRVVELMARLKQAGVPQVGLLTQPPEA